VSLQVLGVIYRRHRGCRAADNILMVAPAFSVLDQFNPRAITIWFSPMACFTTFRHRNCRCGDTFRRALTTEDYSRSGEQPMDPGTRMIM